MYSMVPIAVSPTPIHHHLSALNGSLGVRIVFLFRGSFFSPLSLSIPRLIRLLLVGLPADADDVAVGFRVEVGSI